MFHLFDPVQRRRTAEKTDWFSELFLLRLRPDGRQPARGKSTGFDWSVTLSARRSRGHRLGEHWLKCLSTFLY